MDNGFWWLDKALYVSLACFFIAGMGAIYLLVTAIRRDK